MKTFLKALDDPDVPLNRKPVGSALNDLGQATVTSSNFSFDVVLVSTDKPELLAARMAWVALGDDRPDVSNRGFETVFRELTRLADPHTPDPFEDSA